MIFMEMRLVPQGGCVEARLSLCEGENLAKIAAQWIVLASKLYKLALGQDIIRTYSDCPDESAAHRRGCNKIVPPLASAFAKGHVWGSGFSSGV
jgi:hypothetical protein